jgi:bifunctional non-homologous end joining protein LigD
LRRAALAFSMSVAVMLEVSHADRIVFPAVNRSKGDVVAYYDRIASRALPHLLGRPLSIRRYPKGLAGPGFFQKNVPAHYPPSFQRFEIPRSREASKKHKGRGKEQNVTIYPLLSGAEQLPYLANQGAIELHVPTARASALFRPDRLVIDLDPPAGAFDLVRRAALIARDALGEYGLTSVPVATGSKGYHVVAPIQTSHEVDVLSETLQKFTALLAAAHPDELTTQFRVAQRGERVFLDWLRNNPLSTMIAPYSLRATARATVATPLRWDELPHTDPNAFTIDDVERLLERPDTLAELSAAPGDPQRFVSEVARAFERSGLVIEPFDRFRS